MKQNMQRKLEQLAQRLDELNQTLSQEDITSKLDLYRALMREHAELAPLVEHYAQWQQAHADEQTARGMLDDPALRDFAADEARDRMAQLEAQLQTLLLPKDPDDARNIFLEIRAGTGCEESALFAGVLLRMYLRYAERQRWQVEILSESLSETGGYKEVIARIAGH